MCVVSMVIDHFHDKWNTPYIPPQPFQPFIPSEPKITKEEIEEFRRLLERAREYDRRNNQPDCEMDEKKKMIKDLADKLGVQIDFL